ncbi:hypothetical protein DBR32_10535 [Taibaiella sp. KBW10]|uniref:hypothetical protein n=1 Tax=Taibaiella sp. KBW10 TaxID=2153357 RepID=UPI000F59C302|nr:hypothetical protein [Taibaiella sp. KBW10]RQO31131.1 hypothetical protein DBR32_10535 [Taibaiella sp. KBW10]
MKLKKSTFILLLLCLCFNGIAQKPAATGIVYVIRPMNYTGSIIAYNIYADDQLVCKLKNQRYSVHTLPVGNHTFSIKNTGLGNHSMSKPIPITVKADQAVYLDVVDEGQLNLKELTAPSGIESLKSVAEMKNCLPKQKTK